MIKKIISSALKKRIRRLGHKMPREGSNKIFCISMQRNGTTSVGDFFKHFGYSVAKWRDSWRNQWSLSWYNGDFESIFNSNDFKSYQVFEDDPWWLPEFYKILYHRFPHATFILFTRDSDAWFQSMLANANGQTLGNTKRHCKAYRREKEYYQKLDTNPTFHPSNNSIDKLLTLVGHEQHYKDLYEIRNRELIDFFTENDSSRLIHCKLEDPDKWKKLGSFYNIHVPDNFTIHSNKTKVIFPDSTP